MTKFRLNPKVLYSYVRDKSKIRSTISQLEKPDGSVALLATTCREESAEVLNHFFESVFTTEDPNTVPTFTPVVSTSLVDIHIIESDVYNELLSLKPNKAPGSDQLHPQMIKNCASSLTRPLFLLFTQSLDSGMVPDDWKRANITPVSKKGSKIIANNYRPISLTSHVVKILESLIRAKMLQYLMDNNIIADC